MLLTHLSEVIRNNLAQLLSYKDMRALLDRLEPEYKRLIDDICPSQISYSGLQAVLKLLLAERVSIRNLHLILEAIAEIAPHVRRSEQVAEHVRMRMAQQICGDLSEDGVLKRAAPRQPLGSRLPPEPEARRQGRGRRVRHRSAPGRAVRRRGVRGDPQAHGRGQQLRPGDRARRAALCPHDHRAPVPDASRAVACRDRARRRDQVARDHLVTAIGPPAVLAAFVALLPHRRLPHADARLLQPARSGRRSGCSSRFAITLALTPLLLPQVLGRSQTPAADGLAPSIVSEIMIGGDDRHSRAAFLPGARDLGTAVTMAIGFGAIPGTAIEDSQPAAGAGVAHHDVGGHPALRHRPALGGPARADRVLRLAMPVAQASARRSALDRASRAA